MQQRIHCGELLKGKAFIEYNCTLSAQLIKLLCALGQIVIIRLFLTKLVDLHNVIHSLHAVSFIIFADGKLFIRLGFIAKDAGALKWEWKKGLT